MQCPECGTQAGPDEKFCGNCGAPLQAPEGTPPEEGPMSPPEPEGSSDVEEPIIGSAEGLEAVLDNEPVVVEAPPVELEPLAPPPPPLAEEPMHVAPPPPPPPVVESTSKSKTGLIVAIVVLVILVLCCCCVLGVLVSSNMSGIWQGIQSDLNVAVPAAKAIASHC